MTNRILDTPPTNVDISTPANNLGFKGVSGTWVEWFSNLLRKVSVDASRQYITQAQAVNLDAQHVGLTTTTDTYAITLAAPTSPGIMLTIELTSFTATKNVTLALTNVVGGTAASTCTWNSEGDTLVLISLAQSKWLVLKEYGVSLS